MDPYCTNVHEEVVVVVVDDQSKSAKAVMTRPKIRRPPRASSDYLRGEWSRIHPARSFPTPSAPVGGFQWRWRRMHARHKRVAKTCRKASTSLVYSTRCNSESSANREPATVTAGPAIGACSGKPRT